MMLNKMLYNITSKLNNLLVVFRKESSVFYSHDLEFVLNVLIN